MNPMPWARFLGMISCLKEEDRLDFAIQNIHSIRNSNQLYWVIQALRPPHVKTFLKELIEKKPVLASNKARAPKQKPGMQRVLLY